MDMEQSTLNWAFGVINICIGIGLKFFFDSLNELRKADKDLTEKVSKIEVVVAGQYVTKADFDSTINILFSKLDKISDKLDQKADK